MRLTPMGCLLIAASVSGLLCGGCEPSSPTAGTGQQSQNTAAVPQPGPGVIEAKDATGVWNKGQVEQYLRENLKLSSLSLESTGDNGYKGTGKGQDGETFTSIIVKQVPGGIKTTWSTPNGDGKMSFGNPVP